MRFSYSIPQADGDADPRIESIAVPVNPQHFKRGSIIRLYGVASVRAKTVTLIFNPPGFQCEARTESLGMMVRCRNRTNGRLCCQVHAALWERTPQYMLPEELGFGD